MRGHSGKGAWLRAAMLAALLALAALAEVGSSIAQGARSGLEGACYCRAGGHLECLGQFTESECTRRCQEALCDDWFWLERRPCWNWGYGG